MSLMIFACDDLKNTWDIVGISWGYRGDFGVLWCISLQFTAYQLCLPAAGLWARCFLSSASAFSLRWRLRHDEPNWEEVLRGRKPLEDLVNCITLW